MKNILFLIFGIILGVSSINFISGYKKVNFPGKKTLTTSDFNTCKNKKSPAKNKGHISVATSPEKTIEYQFSNSQIITNMNKISNNRLEVLNFIKNIPEDKLDTVKSLLGSLQLTTASEQYNIEQRNQNLAGVQEDKILYDYYNNKIAQISELQGVECHPTVCKLNLTLENMDDLAAMGIIQTQLPNVGGIIIHKGNEEDYSVYSIYLVTDDFYLKK